MSQNQIKLLPVSDYTNITSDLSYFDKLEGESEVHGFTCLGDFVFEKGSKSCVRILIDEKLSIVVNMMSMNLGIEGQFMNSCSFTSYFKPNLMIDTTSTDYPNEGKCPPEIINQFVSGSASFDEILLVHTKEIKNHPEHSVCYISSLEELIKLDTFFTEIKYSVFDENEDDGDFKEQMYIDFDIKKSDVTDNIHKIFEEFGCNNPGSYDEMYCFNLVYDIGTLKSILMQLKESSIRSVIVAPWIEERHGDGIKINLPNDVHVVDIFIRLSHILSPLELVVDLAKTQSPQFSEESQVLLEKLSNENYENSMAYIESKKKLTQKEMNCQIVSDLVDSYSLSFDPYDSEVQETYELYVPEDDGITRINTNAAEWQIAQECVRKILNSENPESMFKEFINKWMASENGSKQIVFFYEAFSFIWSSIEKDVINRKEVDVENIKSILERMNESSGIDLLSVIVDATIAIRQITSIPLSQNLIGLSGFLSKEKQEQNIALETMGNFYSNNFARLIPDSEMLLPLKDLMKSTCKILIKEFNLVSDLLKILFFRCGFTGEESGILE